MWKTGFVRRHEHEKSHSCLIFPKYLLTLRFGQNPNLYPKVWPNRFVRTGTVSLNVHKDEKISSFEIWDCSYLCFLSGLLRGILSFLFDFFKKIKRTTIKRKASKLVYFQMSSVNLDLKARKRIVLIFREAELFILIKF